MSVLSILEDVLQTHPAVAQAAVVASPEKRLGEVPKAFIVPRRPASPRELIAWVADQVAPYPRIRRVEFVEQLPKSLDGKILHGLLAARERAAFAGSDAGRSLPWPQRQRPISQQWAA
jgi:acyl-coenzyme A synthetase/AMP-(fatty) acid ligase